MKSRLQEIETRKREIKDSLENLEDVEEIRKLNDEVDVLNAEEKEIKEAEERKNIAENIAKGNINARKIEKEEEIEMENKFDLSSNEYRNAYLKNLMGKELTVEERAVITSTTENSAGNAIPTETSNSIFDKVSQKAPMLDEITLLNVRGNVDFVVEIERTAAADHTEGTSITESDIKLVKVSLAGKEIVKLVTISETVKSMTIDAFEDWLTDMLSDSIANAIEGKITTVIETNGTKIEKNISADTLRETVGTLPAFYDGNAKWLVNKKKFFTEILGLQDKAKHDLVTFANGKYYILGYEVLMSDKATKLSLGDAKKVVANLAQDIQVKSAYDIKTNTYDYSGVALFDVKLATSDAYVVLTGAIASSGE